MIHDDDFQQMSLFMKQKNLKSVKLLSREKLNDSQDKRIFLNLESNASCLTLELLKDSKSKLQQAEQRGQVLTFLKACSSKPNFFPNKPARCYFSRFS